VHATRQDEYLILKTIILDYDGSKIFETKSKAKFTLNEGLKLAKKAAQKTKKTAAKLLEKICKNY
jgi:porphobilinogen deaminase